MKLTKHLLFLICLICAASSCYRMPTEDDYCVVPRTNNPDLVRAKPAAPSPSVNY